MKLQRDHMIRRQYVLQHQHQTHIWHFHTHRSHHRSPDHQPERRYRHWF